MLNRILLSFGDIIKFTRDGTALTNMGGAAVSGVGIAPDGTTPADWKDFTTVEDGEITGKFTDEEIFAPAPGCFRRKDVFRTMAALDVKIIGQEVNEIILESVLQTAPLTTIAAQPNNKSGQIRGWLQLSRADQTDAVVLLCTFYGVMSVKTMKADGKRYKPQIDFAVLHNALNTITPTLAGG